MGSEGGSRNSADASLRDPRNEWVENQQGGAGGCLLSSKRKRMLNDPTALLISNGSEESPTRRDVSIPARSPSVWSPPLSTVFAQLLHRL